MSSTSRVHFGSVRSASATAEHSIVAKFDAVAEKLRIKEAVKNKTVAIKMHIGAKTCITTVHPLLVGRLVDVIREAGGKPYLVDIMEWQLDAAKRGYTSEAVGCPILPAAGPADRYYIEKEVNYKGLKTLQLGGNIKDADILIGLAHLKGHNSIGYGGAIKNLALGCFTQKTRFGGKGGGGGMHGTMQWDKYWDKEKCKDAKRLVKACPFECIKYKDGSLKVEFDLCNQCMRCIAADTDGCLQIKPENFLSFVEINAIATQFVLSHFSEENRFFLNVAMNITEYCDCWGFSTGQIFTDLGILGSRNLVALDKACLDLLADKPLIKENVSQNLEVNDDPKLHPFARLHGPYKDPYNMIRLAQKYGLGSSDYELEEVLPPIPEPKRTPPHFPKAEKPR